MRIRDVVSPTLGVRYEEASGLTLDRMRSFGIQHIIVTRQNAIEGVVSEGDLERACLVNPEQAVGELATAVPVLDCEAFVAEAATLMRDRKVGCVPVTDHAAIAGIVTIEKLLDLIGQGIMQSRRRR